MTLTTAAKISAAYMLAVMLAGMASELIATSPNLIAAGSQPGQLMTASSE